mgnify:CR=1 FL=1
MSYYLAAPFWTLVFLGALWLLVHGIDRLDRWGRRSHPSLRIVVPEQVIPADVVDLNSHRTAV